MRMCSWKPALCFVDFLRNKEKRIIQSDKLESGKIFMLLGIVLTVAWASIHFNMDKFYVLDAVFAIHLILGGFAFVFFVTGVILFGIDQYRKRKENKANKPPRKGLEERLMSVLGVIAGWLDAKQKLLLWIFFADLGFLLVLLIVSLEKWQEQCLFGVISIVGIGCYVHFFFGIKFTMATSVKFFSENFKKFKQYLKGEK